MEKIDIVLWVMGGGFTLMLVMWGSLNKRMDKIDSRIEKLDEKVTDIDRRVCRIEGMMTKQEGCAIRASNDIREAQ